MYYTNVLLHILYTLWYIVLNIYFIILYKYTYLYMNTYILKFQFIFFSVLYLFYLGKKIIYKTVTAFWITRQGRWGQTPCLNLVVVGGGGKVERKDIVTTCYDSHCSKATGTSEHLFCGLWDYSCWPYWMTGYPGPN